MNATAYTLILSFPMLWITAAPAQSQSPGAGGGRSDSGLFLATATLGLGDCNELLCGASEANTAPSLGMGAGFFIRPIPYFAGGAELHYNLMSADDEDRNREGEVGRYFLANMAVRGIVPVGIVEPWAGIGLGYAWFGYAWDKDKKSEDLTVDGINLALSLGTDVRLGDRWTIGGMFRFAFPSWSERCKEKIEPDGTKLECQDTDSLDVAEREELPDRLWYLGVTGRFELG
jgi:hypothetical protein